MTRYPVLIVSLIVVLAAAVTAGHEFPDPRQFEEGSREWLYAVDALKYKPFMHDSLTESCPHSFDVLHYNISLLIVIGDETIAGNTVVTAVSEEAGLDSIDLDLTVLTVDSVYSGGSPVSFVHNDPVLSIDLGAAHAVGDTFEVQVFYGGVPGNEGPTGFGGFYFGGLPTHAYQMGVGLEADPPSMGKFWFPCWDWPCDKATSEYHISLSGTNKKARCNGEFAGTDYDSVADVTTWHWDNPFQIPPHCMTVNAGRFLEMADSTYPWITHWVFPAFAEDAEIHFENVALMMEGFLYRYGSYPFTTFGYVQEAKGDMEHQTCVTHTTGAIQPNHVYDWLLAHEMGHMWWGDCVSVGDWRDVWLSEGFATYGEALYREYGYGMEDYHSYVQSSLMGPAFAAGRNSPIYDPNNLWGSLTYEKGATVLHMLRHVIGDSLFFASLAEYRQTYEYSYAVTPDFIAVVESVSGQDLDWFFDEWIYDVGWPDYEYLWSAAPSGPDYEIALTIDQVHTEGPVYTMPVDIGITTAGGDTLIVVWVDDAHEEFAITVHDQPTMLEIDPDNWILNTAVDLTAGVPEDTPEVAGLGLEAVPNPFGASTRIRFSVPGSQHVKIEIFDAAGRRVESLVDGLAEPGWNEVAWDGRGESGNEVAPGTYFCRMTSEDGVRTARMVHLR
ncbi:MAG: M1 family aminopeptidase [bacterium]|jgi:aminopeptidase N